MRRAEQRRSPGGQFRATLVFKFAFDVHYELVHKEEKRQGRAANIRFQKSEREKIGPRHFWQIAKTTYY